MATTIFEVAACVQCWESHIFREYEIVNSDVDYILLKRLKILFHYNDSLNNILMSQIVCNLLRELLKLFAFKRWQSILCFCSTIAHCDKQFVSPLISMT